MVIYQKAWWVQWLKPPCLIAQPKANQPCGILWATMGLDARLCLRICPGHPQSQHGIWWCTLKLALWQTRCQSVQLDSHCPQCTKHNICLLLCSITFVIPFYLIMPKNKSIQSIRVAMIQQVFLCHCCFSLLNNEYKMSINGQSIIITYFQ